MIKKAKDLAVHEKDTGSSEVQIALLTEKIETLSKRASRAAGFSWGVSEDVGKCVKVLELFGLPGIKNLNQY